MPSIDDLLKLFKEPLSILFAIGLTGLAILTLPDRMASPLGFNYLLANYRHWVGVTSFLLLLISGMGGVAAIYRRIEKWRSTQKAKVAFKKHIPTLDRQERLYLAYCLAGRLNTLRLELVDPVAHS